MVLRRDGSDKEGRRGAIRKKLLNDRCLFTRMTWRPIKSSGIGESVSAFDETDRADDRRAIEKYQLEFNRDFLAQARSSYLRGENDDTQ